ncbi:hypothetical protein JCM33374_g4667 [Metschnikowia sp. JCM 33374]|nr:hypothetical protein JCM33374_g4667 [Metschnikowia sp. JCM 33374]
MSERGRPTKWGGKSARFIDIGGQKLDTIITGHLTQEQINAYQQYFRVEEISHLLRKAGAPGTSIIQQLPSYKVATFQREPSPPPQYDQSGNRTNTRELRVQASLEKERHALVELAVTTIKNYDPPVDYKKPAKTSEKLYIPIKDYPDINFVGLLLGPRGNTLRQLQEDSGAKLAIRGKGSVKDGKSSDGAGFSAPEDDLHVVITADTTSKIHKAIKLTNEVIEKAISSPVGQNDLKRDQLRELAVLNGTLRETKPYVPPEIFNSQRRSQARDITQIVCRICGNVGHYSRDCKLKNDAPAVDSYSPGASPGPQSLPSRRPLDEEVPPWKRARTDQAPAFSQPHSSTPPWVSQQNYGTSSYGAPTHTSPGGKSAYGNSHYSSTYSSQYGQPNSQHVQSNSQYGQQNPQNYIQPSSQYGSQYGSQYSQYGSQNGYQNGSHSSQYGQQYPQPPAMGGNSQTYGATPGNSVYGTPYKPQASVPPPPSVPVRAHPSAPPTWTTIRC